MDGRADEPGASPRQPDPAPLERPKPARTGLFGARRAAIAEEIDRNRRGDYTVPTWVLAAVLAIVIAGIAAFIVFG